ncbi:hypothetical protein GCM10007304_08230 [Rhodococcoides trifolii]|uniref:Mce-associated membrane protein n=1 Tax=Rhodococcoides trifolii TaxID=908250 RepID=A0A917FQV0_9NOCA|nr:hypothetical protein [Rhodococcus trifolii]GGF96609.1 hypothetical protein GCM10007304_08230 [Rhodococcus trifolii]
MPPPRRQNPTGPSRRPRVAGRTGVPAGEKPVAPESQAPEEKASASVDLGKQAPAKATTLNDYAGKPAQPAKLGSIAAEPASTAQEAESIEESTGTKKKKATAPYRLSKPKTDQSDYPQVAPDRPHSRKMARVTIAAAVLALLFAIVAVVAGLKPGTTEVTNQAWIDDAATNEVSAAATTALQTVFSYKVDTIDQDQDAARAVLDGDRLNEYNESAEQTKQGVLQTKTTSVAVVTDIGVSVLQDDNAQIVASMDISANQDGVDQGTVQTPVVVTMTRVDGKWLISQIDNR